MKTFKKLFFVAMFAIVAIALVACKGGSKGLDKAYKNLEVQLAEGDTLEAVTQNVTLPSKDGDVVITWKSSDIRTINVDGTVYRQKEDKDVTLTATLILGKDSKTKEFQLKVLKTDQIAGLADKVRQHYADTIGKDSYLVTADLELISEVEGQPITWSSNKTDILSNEGKVNRPTYAEGNASVTLKATVGGEIVTFFVTVKSQDQTVEEAIDEVLVVATRVAASTTGYQEENFAAITEADITYQGTTEKVAITWTSSDETVMTAAGVIVPFADAPEKKVTLTASITYKEVTRTRSVDFKIKGVDKYETFASALVPANDGKKGLFPAVKIYGMADGAKGYYLIDPEGELAYVYSTNLPEGHKKDDVYQVIATIGNHYNAAQLNDVIFTRLEGNTTTFKPLKTVEITIADQMNNPKPSAEAWGQATAYLYKNVRVAIDSSITDPKYNVFLVPKDSAEGDFSSKVMVYYQSDYEVIKSKNGLKLQQIVLINHGWRTDKNCWYGAYLGDGSELQIIAIPEELTQAAADAVKEATNGKHLIKAEEQLTIPAAPEGIKVTIESNKPEVLGNNCKVVALPAEGTVEEVTLTITATKGEGVDAIVKTATAKVKVGVPAVETIESARAKAKGTVVTIEGVYIVDLGSGSHAIQDATAGIVLRDNKVTLGLVNGNKVKVTGEMDAYNGLIQIKQYTFTKGENTTVTASELADLQKATTLAKESQAVTMARVIIKQTLAFDKDNNLVGKLEDEAGNVIDVRVSKSLKDSPVVVAIKNAAYPVGKELKLKLGVVGQFKGTPQFVYVEFEEAAPLTEEQKVDGMLAAAKAKLDGKTLDMDTQMPELPATDPRYEGSQISYAYNPTDAVTADGKTKVVTENLTVTATITVKLGETTKTATATFTVKYLDPDAAATYTETFEGASIGASYTDFTHTGVNDTEFRMTHVRDEGDYGIDGNGVMLRGGEAGKDSAFEFTVTNGLSALSFDYKKAFTGQTLRKWNVELVQDEVVVKTHEIPEFNDADTTHKVELTDLNLTGEVTIRIVPRTTSKSMQMTIDNITWTEAE